MYIHTFIGVLETDMADVLALVGIGELRETAGNTYTIATYVICTYTCIQWTPLNGHPLYNGQIFGSRLISH